VDWYQQEIDRFHELAGGILEQNASDETEDAPQLSPAQYTELLDKFSAPFQQTGGAA
jgi:hypothetical protein